MSIFIEDRKRKEKLDMYFKTFSSLYLDKQMKIGEDHCLYILYVCAFK
jgi:hypothetical protein